MFLDGSFSVTKVYLQMATTVRACNTIQTPFYYKLIFHKKVSLGGLNPEEYPHNCK